MPTVDKIGSLRVVIYPNDHRPAHVHVIGKDCEAVFKLNCPEGPPGAAGELRLSGERAFKNQGGAHGKNSALVH